MVFSAVSDDLLELISKCLQYNPLRRWSASEALQSAYFRSPPFACDDAELTKIEIDSEQRKRRFRDSSNEPKILRRKLEF